jgi:voltage-gated potassium channel
MSEAPESKLLRLAKSPEDAAALRKFNDRMALPLVLAALLPIVLIPGENAQEWLVAIVVVVSWLVFVLDFTEHMRHLHGYLGTWWGRFDLTVVVLTAPWFLLLPGQSAKFVMLVRIARLGRVLLASGGMRRLFERLGRVALVAGIVVLLGSAIAYHAEHPTNPEYKTFGDALWWGIVTLTTVGYGDIVPKTTEGRFAGVMIMITGIAVLGLLAGSLASFFRLDPKPGAAGDVPESGDAGIDAITTELALVRSQLVQLTDQIARLRAPSSAPTSATSAPPAPEGDDDDAAG